MGFPSRWVSCSGGIPVQVGFLSRWISSSAFDCAAECGSLLLPCPPSAFRFGFPDVSSLDVRLHLVPSPGRACWRCLAAGRCCSWGRALHALVDAAPASLVSVLMLQLSAPFEAILVVVVPAPVTCGVICQVAVPGHRDRHWISLRRPPLELGRSWT